MVWSISTSIFIWAKDLYKTGIFKYFYVLVVPRSGGQDSAMAKTPMACNHSSSTWFYGQSALCTGIEK